MGGKPLCQGGVIEGDAGDTLGKRQMYAGKALFPGFMRTRFQRLLGCGQRRVNIVKTDTGRMPVPLGIIWMILIVIIMSFVLNKTRIGRYTIAIGSNKEALKLSGVNVLKWHILAYMVCGLFTGLAAVTYAATFSNITPGQGAGFELNAIGAAIIGGTAMTGGSGSVFGTFLGVLLISLLQVGLPFVGLNADWQLLITGCILMGAVTIDKMRNSK